MRIGWATRSITPNRPVLLQGQMHNRIAREAMDPITVTAMAIEGDPAGASGAAANGDAPHRAVIVSFDLAFISGDLMAAVRSRVARAVPGLPPDNLIMTATHTHASLLCLDGLYVHPGGDVMTAKECDVFLADRAAEAVIEAWESLAPARIGRAFGHAVVAHNRRPYFADGSSRMYGKAAGPDFRGLEGQEDHSLDMLFVWDAADRLIGIMLGVPCPSQVDEMIDKFSADFWHETRAELRRRLGERLWVLPLCGIAGDQSPHFILDGKQEEEMRKRRGVTERQEIAERLAGEVERALACTKPGEGEPLVAHAVKRVALTPRRVSKPERDFAEAERGRAIQRMDPRSWWPARLQWVVDIHDGKQKAEPVKAELHFLRLGDMVLATNPFELYVDYGQQIKARSAAAQTFLVQLTAGLGWYLPTERAVKGGSYGAMPAVCAAGPEGGQELVEHTVKGIAELFA